MVLTAVIKVETEDIEDICTLCDPIPILEGCGVPLVTSYPMKTERKKQREELNIVSVVEWRGDDDRWFLLTRRPEGGPLYSISATKLSDISVSTQDSLQASTNFPPHPKCPPQYLSQRRERPL
jgi:hypothetical protein